MPELALSLRSLLNSEIDRLRMAGFSDARREAMRLWTELTRGNAGEALLDDSVDVDPTRAADFRRAISRRALGEPLAYVTGVAGFRHLVLQSDRRALIPRPETEGLVDLLLSRVRSGLVADLGTGSGCIALSLAQEGAFERLVGVDCSSEALALARINSELLGFVGRMDFVRGDLGTALRAVAFDALISNPPYLTLDEHAQLDDSVRVWEPALALISGADGLNATRLLIDHGRYALRPGGWLALEVDCNRAAAVARLARDYGWDEVSIHMDLFGRERYLLARRSETR